MFLVPKQFKRKDGSIPTTYSLCETPRVDELPGRKIFLNLGKYFSLAKEHWPTLLTSVFGRLIGAPALAFEQNERIDVYCEQIFEGDCNGWNRIPKPVKMIEPM